MKLKELQNLIFDDLIIDTGKQQYKDVWKDGYVFDNLKEKEVIAIRCEGSYLVIRVR